MIIAHAKWDDVNSSSFILWIDLIDDQKTLDSIVKQRLIDAPENILLLRYEQIINQNDNADVCAKHREMYQRNINNTGLYYLSIRCITDKEEKNTAYIKASTQHPDDPWLANAAGLTYLEQQQFSKAAAKFDTAFQHSTVLKPIVAVCAARLQKATNPSAKLGEYANYVPYLRHLLAVESAGIESPYYPYVLISQGKLTDSHQSIRTNDEEAAARTLRLLAASKGATQKMIDQALTLPITKGLDYSTIWPAIGLAIKNNRDWEELINQAQSKYGEAAFTELPVFIKFVVSEDYSSANSLLKNMQPDTVGYYYVLASVLKPKSVPSNWKTLANGLLFTTEKPFL
jgi:hypothetical protein